MHEKHCLDLVTGMHENKGRIMGTDMCMKTIVGSSEQTHACKQLLGTETCIKTIVRSWE